MGPGAEDEPSVFRHGVEGVDGQREDGVQERGGVGVDGKLAGSRFGDDLVALGEAAAKQLRGIQRERIKIVRGPFAGANM